MATTKDSLNKDRQAFSEAFNEPEQEPTSQTEDEAFGITPDVSADDGQGSGNAPAVTIAVEDPASEGNEGGESAAPSGDAPAATQGSESAPAADSSTTDDWKQKYKTLKGKYNAETADLKARLEAAEANKGGATSGEAGEAPDGDGDTPTDSGVPASEAEAKLTEDFGAEFVAMIKSIAMAQAEQAAAEAAGKTVGDVRKSVEDLIAGIKDEAQRSHFETIADAHPDFMDIAESEPFQKWLASRPESEKEEDKRILESGRAREIVKLLNVFKKDSAAPANADNSSEADDAAAAAAEGVRSPGGGIKLPERPSAVSGDYASAWEEA